MSSALAFGVTKLISWRWRSAWESVADILRLETLLRNAFDAEKYIGAGDTQDADGAESTGDKQVRQVAQAISDPLFWCEALLFQCLNAVVAHIESWAGSCPCHGESRQKKLNSPCPLVGLLAPELATGTLAAHIELVQVAESTLLRKRCSTDLDHKSRDSVIARLEKGLHLVVAEMKLRAAVWDTIPHKICGLSAIDDSLASAAASACLSQWDKCPEESLHHPLSNMFLSNKPHSLRKQVEEMARGVRLHDLDDRFRSCVCRLRLVPVCESSIEGSHSRMKRLLSNAPRYSAPYASLRLRSPEICQMLEKQPLALQDPKSKTEKNLNSTLVKSSGLLRKLPLVTPFCARQS